MKRSLVDRRERTFELLIVKGQRYGKVVSTIASEYDISEAGVESDIRRMDKWLPELVENDYARKDGLTRLKELRMNRREMHNLYDELKDRIRADEDADPEVLLKVLDKIDSNIDLDIALSQSLGLAEREPAQLEVDHQFEVRSEVVEVSAADVQDGGGDDD